MVRIGIAGIGFMGMIHYLASKSLTNGRVSAICTRDQKKLSGDWTGIQGNFGPPGEKMDLGSIHRHETYEQMLADPDVDLVDVCTPTHLHCSMVIAALKAGKHVIVEKAISLSPEEADQMVAAAREAGKLLMVAHLLPFFPEFRFAYDAIAGGSYGKLLGGHFTRIISRPEWSSDIADASKTGGPAVDLHVHDTHFIRLIAGMPREVFSIGKLGTDNSVEYLTTSYLYGSGGPAITCSSGALAMSGRQFVHGFELYLEQATLVHSSSGQPLTVFSADGKAEVPSLPSGDPVVAFTNELQSAVEAVHSGNESNLLSGQLARDALVLCHRECESVRSARIVVV